MILVRDWRRPRRRCWLRATRRIAVLLTPENAAAFYGAGYLARCRIARAQEFPDVAFTLIVDCGDTPGYALACLRAGVQTHLDVAAQRQDRRHRPADGRRTGKETDMSWQPTRDLVGYGANPPDPKWPNGARVAINFVVNYEEGSEPSVQDGEGYTETGLTESSTSSVGLKGRDLAGEGMFEFGSRVGFWRIMRAFQERGLPLTVFGCALALERNTPAAEAITQVGLRRLLPRLALGAPLPAERSRGARAHRARPIKSLKQTVGERPAGWYCRYGPSVNTRRLLVEEGGFTYDSDYYGEELPFWQTVEGKPHLVVPYSLTNNDGKYAAGMVHSDQWFSLVPRRLRRPLPGGRHGAQDDVGRPAQRLIGHPGRIAGLWRFLDYVQKHKDVWVTRRIDIANHWKATHPYKGKGFNE